MSGSESLSELESLSDVLSEELPTSDGDVSSSGTRYDLFSPASGRGFELGEVSVGAALPEVLSASDSRPGEGDGFEVACSVSSMTDSPSLKTERDLYRVFVLAVFGAGDLLLGVACVPLLGEKFEGPGEDRSIVNISANGEGLRNLAERIGWTLVLCGLASRPWEGKLPLAGEL